MSIIQKCMYIHISKRNTQQGKCLLRTGGGGGGFADFCTHAHVDSPHIWEQSNQIQWNAMVVEFKYVVVFVVVEKISLIILINAAELTVLGRI